LRKWEFDFPELGVFFQEGDEVLCGRTLRQPPESALLGKNGPDFLQFEDVVGKPVEVLDDVGFRDLDSCPIHSSIRTLFIGIPSSLIAWMLSARMEKLENLGSGKA
jgi:hypothetical protein